MPKNKNAMTRFWILDELLSCRYHNYSISDMTDIINDRLAEIDPASCGVVKRTIEKDIRYLEVEGPFCIEMERYTVPAYNKEKQKNYAKKCLRYADPSYSLFKKKLTSDEKYLLREVLSIVGQFEGLPNLEGLESLRLSLGLTSDDERHIVSFTRNPIEHSSIFAELFTAISQRQVVELYYHLFSAPDNKKSVNFCPYMLKEYNRRWYLIGGLEENGKILNFGLERIDACVPLPSHEYRDYEGNLNEHFEDIVGVTLMEEAPLEKIILWASDNARNYIDTKPLHESQRTLPQAQIQELRQKHPSLDGGKLYRIDCKENYELIRELLSFRKELLVLEPRSLQDKVFECINQAQQEYLKLRT